jgi:hypothetical protein
MGLAEAIKAVQYVEDVVGKAHRNAEAAMDLLASLDASKARALALSWCDFGREEDGREAGSMEGRPVSVVVDSLLENGFTDIESISTPDFYTVAAIVHASEPLDTSEISRIAGCVGYALREHCRGEDLGPPTFTRLACDRPRNSYLLEMTYDSTKSRSDDPDFCAAFEAAEDYARNGTPIRTTNRAGAGTKGTRLIEGVPSVRSILFYVR